MSDLFTNGSPKSGYDASEIEFWKGWSPSGIARACISAALTSAPCITWRPKFWIIPWMRRLPDMPIGLNYG